MRVLLLLSALSCATTGPTGTDTSVRDASLPAPTLVAIAPGVFVHTSWKRLSEGPFPSNGLLLCGLLGGVLVDSAFTDADTVWLLDEAERRSCKVTDYIATHFHDDRIGGLASLRARHVRTHASAQTRDLAAARGGTGQEGWQPIPIPEDGDALGLIVFQPGPGHSPDNIVVWVPEHRILFGGCLVKSATSTTLGNVADADLAAWPKTIRRVMERFPDAAVVIPGHGAPGTRALLDHTLLLLSPTTP